MINSKLELQFYICADSMMNRGYFEKSLLMKVVSLIRPDWIMEYLTALRKVEYYSNRGGVQRYYYKYRFRKLGMKLGFTISENVFGYGLVIPHYGTIVVGELSEYLNRDICQPEGFDAYGYPSELFKLDMERLGIAAKRKPAKVIDFAQYIENNRGTND